MPINDLRCDDCMTIEPDVTYRLSDGIPECPDCSQPRRVDWSHGKAPAAYGEGYGSFTPIDMGVLGKAETKEDYDAKMKIIQQRFPGHRVETLSETETQRNTRVDEVRHRRYTIRKANGVDMKISAERREEAKAKKAEAAAPKPQKIQVGGR